MSPGIGVTQRLRHRYPFLLADRILQHREGESCVTLKNLSMNEPIFQGHFPGQALFPGVYCIEMMAQAAATVIPIRGDEPEQGVLAQVLNIKFIRTLAPGDQLITTVTLEKSFGSFMKFQGRVECDGTLVAKGSFTVARKP